jgi:hypothetical protein
MMRKRSRLVAALGAAFAGHRKGLIMHKKIAAVMLAIALMLGGTVACAAPADASTTTAQQASSCGPFWLRLWLTFTQPSYVGYLVGSQRCGN